MQDNTPTQCCEVSTQIASPPAPILTIRGCGLCTVNTWRCGKGLFKLEVMGIEQAILPEVGQLELQNVP